MEIDDQTIDETIDFLHWSSMAHLANDYTSMWQHMLIGPHRRQRIWLVRATLSVCMNHATKHLDESGYIQLLETLASNAKATHPFVAHPADSFVRVLLRSLGFVPADDTLSVDQQVILASLLIPHACAHLGASIGEAVRATSDSLRRSART